jgi:hypothetical protein
VGDSSVGSRPGFSRSSHPGVFFAGDCVNGPSTVVEAVAAGKNAALEIDAWLHHEQPSAVPGKVKSIVTLRGYVAAPVSLASDFFGRKTSTPFLLSAAPPTDGFEQMKKAYEAGWSGGIMKTAIDSVPIHIPGEYMFAFDPSTYANCDNVSGHSLDRVCREIEENALIVKNKLVGKVVRIEESADGLYGVGVAFIKRLARLPKDLENLIA